MLLDDISTEEELNDLFDHFRLHYPEIANRTESNIKLPSSHSFYQSCCEQNIDKMASVVSITAEQFGENLTSNFVTHITTDPYQTPDELAYQYISDSLITHSEVLNGKNRFFFFIFFFKYKKF